MVFSPDLVGEKKLYMKGKEQLTLLNMKNTN